MGVRDGNGFVNSAGTAGTILGRDGRTTVAINRTTMTGRTTMAAVTWRYVPHGTCHVLPREPFEKCCVRAAAQTGSSRETKLSGQKRLGLNCVAFIESAPRGQNCLGHKAETQNCTLRAHF